MARFSYRKLTVLSTVAAVALLGVTAILGLCILSKLRVPVSVEQAVVDAVVAFNDQPIRVAEEMTPEQYFDYPKILELCHAISEKRHERVRELMPSVDLNTQGSGGITLLYWAYFSNDLESFKLLLQAGADPDLQLNEVYRFKVKVLRPLLPSDSIFFACLEHRRYDFFFAAIPFTDDVNQKGAASQTSFHRAIVYTSIDRETLARLLDLGFDLNSRDAEGRTILGCTVYAGSGWLCVKWILELAAEKLSDEMLNQIYDLARSTRLHWTVPQEVIAWIETHTPDRIEKIAVSEELTPSQFFDQPELIEFCHVISENDLQELDRLIKTVDVNAQGANGVTPLYWAYFAGNRKAFELLLEAGADPDQKLNGRVKFKKKRLEELQPLDSILFTLVRHGRYDYFFLAMPCSPDVLQTGYHGESLLHAAIRSRNIDKEIMSKLIDAGVDVNARDQYGENAFQWAIEFAFTTDIVTWGLEVAADKMSTVTLVGIYEAACGHAKSGGAHHKQVVEWIEKHIPLRIPISRRRPMAVGVVD